MTDVTTTTYELRLPQGALPIKSWTRGVPVEHDALEQLANIARLPIVHRSVAAMPDVHLGIGATVGSVIPTLGAVIPAAVGVDIGCGMMAVQTTLSANDLPDNIVRGKGDPESFCSCSHGAGRVMSRTQAKKRFTIEDHQRATAGVECRKDKDVIDETPMAYKDIDKVMEAQSDLVDIVHTLKQVVCVKG